MAKEIKLSAARKEKLEEELHYLKTTRTEEVAQQLKEARSQGDLSENSEYDAAKDEQGKLYSRIAELEATLANAVVVEEKISGNRVHMGSKVTLQDVATSNEIVYSIVGTEEADPFDGKISEDSPIGKALIGKRNGDEVTVDAPAGSFTYKIISVKK